MKTFANEYCYDVKCTYDEELRKISTENGYLSVLRNNRYYKTKMKVDDLPEHYCDVNRYYGRRNCIKSTDIVDMNYTWVEENHFMKDSVLRVSFTGKLNPHRAIFEYDGKKIESFFIDYDNLDTMIFGYEIFKFLGYAKKYSNYDLTEIRNEFIKQCEWLKEHEPPYAPDGDFGEYFDNNINKYIT